MTPNNSNSTWHRNNSSHLCGDLVGDSPNWNRNSLLNHTEELRASQSSAGGGCPVSRVWFAAVPEAQPGTQSHIFPPPGAHRDLSVDAGLTHAQFQVRPVPQPYQHYLATPRMHHFPRSTSSTQMVSETLPVRNVLCIVCQKAVKIKAAIFLSPVFCKSHLSPAVGGSV